jgi:elongation factor Ts
MSGITAQAVAELREKTGLGLMQCKKALTETGGDLEAAIDFLRKQGAAVAAKRVDKATKEGKVVLGSANGVVAAVESNCETDFVASSGDFNDFAAAAVQAIAKAKSSDPEVAKSISAGATTLGELQTAAIAKMGENIILRRIVVEELSAGTFAESYSHMNGKIGVIVKLGFEGTPTSTEALSALTKDLCMQVAATSPLAIDTDGMPSDVVEKEREIARELVAKDGKTGDMAERIIDGKVQKFFKENCLWQQPFVKDPKSTIGKLVESETKKIGLSSARILAFHRLQLGQ